MKLIRFLIIYGCLINYSINTYGQNLGVSFSFFFPSGGELSTPVSPFSYRGVALPFTNNVGIQTGVTVYRMPGMNINNIPFDSEKPMFGPNLTGYVPLELYLQLGNQSTTLTLKGGVFGFYSVFTKLNYGNIDRAIRAMENWEVVNAEFEYRKAPGWGYQAGIELLINVTRQWGITMELNYLLGSSPLGLSGSYTGGSNNSIQTVTVEYPDSEVDFSGLEVSLGAVF